MVNFLKTAKQAFAYAADWHRIAYLGAYYIAFIILTGVILLAAGLDIVKLVIDKDLSALAPVLGAAVALGLLFISFALSNILVTATIIHNAASAASGKTASVRESLAQAKKKFVTLLAVTVISVVLSVVANSVINAATLLFILVPLLAAVWNVVSFVASIIIAASLVFVDYQVMLNGKKAVEAVTSSIKLFTSKPKQVLLTLVASFIALVAYMIIGAIVFAILAITSGLLASFLTSGNTIASIATGIIIGGLGALAVVCSASLFGSAFYASVFLQLAGQKGIKPKTGKKK